MISNKMKTMIENNSGIREMFEEGKRLALKYGKENVFDFSLGNPSVMPPKQVNNIIKNCVDEENVHSYMSNAGFDDVREKIAKSLNKKFDTDLNKENITMCVGAAGGLNVILKSILNPDDEVIVLIPYFMEYRNYIDNFGGKYIEVKCNEDFEPDLEDLQRKISNKTKAIIINNPNNPSGIVYSKEIIEKTAEVLRKKEEELN